MNRSGATLVRTRRYVAARAGTYPAPVLREDSGTGPTTPAQQSSPERSAAPAMVAPLPPIAASSPVPPLGAAASAVAPPPEISTTLAPPIPTPAWPDPDATPAETSGAPTAADSPARPIRPTLLGLIAGAVCGAVVGTALLVLANPAQNFARLTDPVGLWKSIDDTSVRLSALGVALGFAILGGIVGWSRRRSAS